jgi:hypothetical protein
MSSIPTILPRAIAKPNRPDSCSSRARVGEWSRHSDLNRGPAVYETAALPLSYVGPNANIADAFKAAVATLEAERAQRRFERDNGGTADDYRVAADMTSNLAGCCTQATSP